MSAFTQIATGKHGHWMRTAWLGCSVVSTCVLTNVQIAAAASSQSRELEVVVVTAQKLEERLQDVPVPVSVISAESLAQSSQLQLQDYFAKVPGLGLTIGGSGRPTINLRGITTGGTSSPTVGIVIDEVPYGFTVVPSAYPTVPDIFPGDLSRIEVLRGPQGTLYGAASMGGLIKYVTADPSADEVSGRIATGVESVSESDDLGYNVRGSINLPLADTLAIRAGAFLARTPGYVDNVLTDKEDVNRRDSKGGRLSALWRPSDVFSLKIGATIQDINRDGTTYVIAPPGSEELQHAFLAGTGYYDRRSEAYSATMNAKVGSVDLISITGYSVDRMNYSDDITPDLGPFLSELADALFGVTGLTLPETQRTTKFTEEVRASIPIGERVTWLLGAFYADERFTDDWHILAADATTGAEGGSLLDIHTPTTYEEYAAFTNLTVEFSERFDVQFGGRFSKNQSTVANFSDGVLTFISPTLPERKAKDDAFTYLVTPRWKISPDLMTYARVASGYRPGAANLNCGGATTSGGFVPCEFGPDETRNYEIGVKGNVLGHTLSFDASLYYIDWKKIQIPLSNPLSYQVNAGGAKSQGVELSVEANPLSGLTLSAWVAFNDAELTDDFPIPSGTGARRGDRLPFSSPFSGSLSVDQEVPLGAELNGSVGATVAYVDDRKDNFQAATRRTFPAYTQIDFRLGLEFGTWTIDAFANNLADKRGILTGGGLNSVSTVYIQPRTVGLQATFNY